MKNLIITTSLTALLAAGAVIGTHPGSASGATLTAAQHSTVHHLPSWVHWRYVPGYWRDNGDCGKLHGKRPIVVWATKGDSSIMICPNGEMFPS